MLRPYSTAVITSVNTSDFPFWVSLILTFVLCCTNRQDTKFVRLIIFQSSSCPTFTALHLLFYWCYKAHQSNPCLSLCIHLTLVYVSWEFIHWNVQHTPTWHTEKHSCTHAEAHRMKHIHTQTQIQWLYFGSIFSRVVTSILPLTWLKWNPIISVMALQLSFCFEGVSLLESPLLGPNVFSKSVMRNGANVQWRQMQCVCVGSSVSFF